MESKRITAVELVQSPKQENQRTIDEMHPGDCFFDVDGDLCMKMDVPGRGGEQIMVLTGVAAGVCLSGPPERKFTVLPKVKIEAG